VKPYHLLTPPDRRKPPQAYTARQLHEMLVADALAHIATPLEWAVRAYREIARQDRISQEAAYQRVRAEVKASGKYGMPVA
jgi:hypothetical protein